MTKKIVGLFATVAMLSSGVALANNEEHKGQQTQSSEQQMGEDIGGSGTQGHMGQMAGEKQVTGTVVKSSSNMLHLRTDNGIIPVKIDKDTQFQDPNVKRAKDLKEGQQVRASFDIKGTDNVAKSITLDTSMGGSGLEDDTGINQDLGGSGLEQEPAQEPAQEKPQDVGGSGDVKY